ALQNAQDLIEAEDIEAAYEVILESVEQGNERAEAYFLLSYTEAVLGKYEEAEEHLQKTIDLEPKMHEAHYNLALVYDELDERQKALESAQEAVRLDPGNEKYDTFLRSLEE
ncbi:tetratricopeptide repeat protein, partial [Halalkalibacterium halodurans]|nr:tetratricopeptide repeat protein [Halalkalibacterium halodurans]